MHRPDIEPFYLFVIVTNLQELTESVSNYFYIFPRSFFYSGKISRIQVCPKPRAEPWTRRSAQFPASNDVMSPAKRHSSGDAYIDIMLA